MLRRSFRALILTAGLAVGVAGTVPLSSQPVGPAHEAGRFAWNVDAAYFGGFSGLEVAENGLDFTALSDRGHYLRGRFKRDNAGNLTGAEIQEITALVPPRAGAWHAYQIDSEGLAIGADGLTFISFEGIHTVYRFDDLKDPANPLPRHADFARMIPNASLEALAIAPDGTLYTLPERSGNLTRPFPVYRFQNGTWDQPFSLPRRDDFLPVGADIGPDGRFYLLERRFSLIRGFASRVRSFTITDDGFSDEVLLFQSQPGRYYDLEGLAVWRDMAGQIRLTMISDDNFNFLQSTEVVEYVVE